MTNDGQVAQPLIETTAGFVAGVASTLVAHPLDVLKTRLQAYEQLKRYRAYYVEVEERDLGTVDYLCLSGASKVFAGIVTYPYQVIRARLQMYEAGQNYKNARDAISQTWKREGLGGFYKGLGPNLVRVLPSTWVTFLVYEKMKVLLPGFLSR
ncbi:MAG: hypothetical protein LQ350_003794 [Teloschistes chrysophthalmus]|nr:MAG: hypothetical protein LQ350_003794 [Niorma chrysophthalma]